MSTVKLASNWETQVIDEISKSDGKVRILGGRAVRHHVLNMVPEKWVRPPGDLDLFTISKHRKMVGSFLEDLGLIPDREFNLLNGRTRLIYRAGDEKVDVFVDEFQMCHKLDLRQRMHLEAVTLPIADLILTKLQIYELTEKDLRDLFTLFYAIPLCDQDEPKVINVRHIAETLAKDWGVWRTCTKNLERLRRLTPSLFPNLDEGSVEVVINKISSLEDAIDRNPKTVAWKMRSVVGERVKWYELPEEP